jgi:multiple sugar transport system substrate-binding protein
MIMRYKNILIAVIASISIFSTACGSSNAGSTKSTSPNTADTKKQTEGTIKNDAQKKDLLVSVWGGPHADVQKKIAADYPNGTITIDDVDYGNLQAKQLTSFGAKSGSGNYDVVWINSQWIDQYVQAEYLLPLDEYVSKQGVDTSIYSKGLLDGCRVNGKLYGLPTYAQCLILCYDTDAFKKAGLTVPKNINELIDVAKYFKSQGSGIAIPAKQGSASTTLFSQMLYSDGKDYFDSNGHLNLTSDAVVQAAGWYDKLVANSIDGCTAWHHDEVAEAVRTKKAPIGIVMSALCNQNYDKDKSLIADTVAYAPLAGASGNASAANTFWIWAVAANSANPDDAAKFCTWMASSETEKKQTLADQQISAVSSLSQDSSVLAATPYLPVVMEELNHGKGDPQTSGFAKLKSSLQAALSEIATTDHDPSKVLAGVQETMKDTDFTK